MYFYAPVLVPVKEKRYKKKVVYLEPPTPGSVTLRRKITTVVPAPAPPPVIESLRHHLCSLFHRLQLL